MQVYPAASLINYAKPGVPIYFIDPNPAISESYYANLSIIPEKAGDGLKKFLEMI
jgi:NAD-dependent deacetylase